MADEKLNDDQQSDTQSGASLNLQVVSDIPLTVRVQESWKRGG